MYFGLGERRRRQPAQVKATPVQRRHADGLQRANDRSALYKHILYLTWKKSAQLAFGLFYDTLSNCTFDMGRELDNYHGHYRYFVADHGDLDSTSSPALHRPRSRAAIPGSWPAGVRPGGGSFIRGRRWATLPTRQRPGTDERASPGGCRQHDILCDSFHLSSGYTSIEGKRYVFNWNRDKFPDPKAFAHHYLDHGVRLYANIKPCLLRDHPRFAEAEAAGLLVHDDDGQPAPGTVLGRNRRLCRFHQSARLRLVESARHQFAARLRNHLDLERQQRIRDLERQAADRPLRQTAPGARGQAAADAADDQGIAQGAARMRPTSART